MKRLLAVLLVTAMLLSMLVACGSESDGSAASAAVESTATEEQAETAQEPVSEESAEAAKEPVSEVESSEGAEVVDFTIEDVELPLVEEEVTVSFWTSLDPRISDYLPTSNVEEALLAYTAIREKTNVNIHLNTVSVFNQAEQFSLMCTSADYDDIIYNVDGLYTTGFSGALEDEVIMDVSGVLEEHAPNVYNTIMNNDELKVQLIDTQNRIGVIPMVYKETGLEEADIVYRLDWAEEFGIGRIETVDQYHDYLSQAKETYGAYAAVGNPNLSAVTTLDGYLLQAMGGYNSFYQIDGVVYHGAVEDTYRKYLEKMNQFWDEGLIPDDVMSLDMTTTQQGFGVGKYSITLCNGAPGISELYAYSSGADGNKTIRATALGKFKDEGVDQWLVSAKNRTMKEGVWSLSSTCSEPELICELANWLFTEEGSLVCNYGVEGTTYTMENGIPQYTDMILNNADGYSTTITINMYATAYVPCIWDQRRTYLDFDEDQLNTIEIFKGEDVNRNNIPSYATTNFWTTDEQEEYATVKSDLDTYMQEMEYSFIMGKAELTDDAWNTYVDTMYEMGLQTVIDLYQAAYDRYAQRLSEL